MGGIITSCHGCCQPGGVVPTSATAWECPEPKGRRTLRNHPIIGHPLNRPCASGLYHGQKPATGTLATAVPALRNGRGRKHQEPNFGRIAPCSVIATLMRILETFKFVGPNPRSDSPVIDRIIAFEEREMSAFAAAGPKGGHLMRAVQEALPDLFGHLPNHGLNTDRPEDALSVLVSGMAVGLQRLAGHRVSELGIVQEDRPLISHSYFEYEDLDTGSESAALAQELLTILLARPQEAVHEALSAWRADLNAFLATATPRAMPGDTYQILLAAHRRSILTFRMDRPPFEAPSGRFRVRPHSLLRLGHGSNQRTIDGTFCVNLSEAAHPLLRDRRQLYERLKAYNAPLPSGEWSPRFCLTPRKAARVADHRGYPVALRGSQRRTGIGPWLNLKTAEEVSTAATEALRQHESILLEPFITGTTHHLVLVGGQLLDALTELPATEAGQPRYQQITELNQDTKHLCEHLASSDRKSVV